MALKQVHLVVRGRVQGVFFRASAQREARTLGVTGLAKNRQDGTVELIAEGDEEVLRDFIGWTHHGPSAARVENVDIRWRAFTGEYDDFRTAD
jgi:acylphosphatase